MNKKYFMGLIALGALTVTSCSNDEVMDAALQQEAKAIQFSTYLGRDVETKGGELKTDGLQGEGKGFGVFAAYTAQAEFGDSHTMNFMYNQQVTSTDGVNWTYSPVKYWPTTNGDKISFFAYAPYKDGTYITDVSGNSANGAPTVTVNQGTDVSKMIDFVAAPIIDQTKTDNVAFTLKHEMSRLGIQAKVSENVYNVSEEHKANKTFINIKSITLKNETGGNFYTSGTYTFASSNSVAGTWSGQQGTELDLSTILNTGTVSVTNATDGTDYQTGVTGVKLTSSTAKTILKNGHYLFLIPATAATGESATGLNANAATATIAYDIVTEDAALKDKYSCTSATKTVSLPQGILKQGLAYTVTFTINVNEIKVSATVGEWTDNTSSISQPTVEYNSQDVTPAP